jgi:hypothetical protein
VLTAPIAGQLADTRGASWVVSTGAFITLLVCLVLAGLITEVVHLDSGCRAL